MSEGKPIWAKLCLLVCYPGTAQEETLNICPAAERALKMMFPRNYQHHMDETFANFSSKVGFGTVCSRPI